MSEEIAAKLVRHGYGVIFGGDSKHHGGDNKGAASEMVSQLDLILNYLTNKAQHYIDPDKLISFDYFFVRRICLYSQGFIVMPAVGTLDEFLKLLLLFKLIK